MSRPPSSKPSTDAPVIRRRLNLRATVPCLLILLGCATAAGQSPFPRPDRPVAAIISAEYSDEATRDRHGEADRVMDRLGIVHGVRVADIGAGSGYYVIRLARRLGPSATIYAEDVNRDYQKGLARRLAQEGITGVTLVLGQANDPQLPAASVDVALLSHMYHEIENPYEFLYRLRPALAPGARVGIIDNDKPTQRHGTPPKLLRCELAAVGYREVGFLSLEPADGYLAIFTPPDTLPPVATIKPCSQ